MQIRREQAPVWPECVLHQALLGSDPAITLDEERGIGRPGEVGGCPVAVIDGPPRALRQEPRGGHQHIQRLAAVHREWGRASECGRAGKEVGHEGRKEFRVVRSMSGAANLLWLWIGRPPIPPDGSSTRL